MRADLERVQIVPALLAQRVDDRGDRRLIQQRGERLSQNVVDANWDVVADVLADLRDRQRRFR